MAGGKAIFQHLLGRRIFWLAYNSTTGWVPRNKGANTNLLKVTTNDMCSHAIDMKVKTNSSGFGSILKPKGEICTQKENE